MNELKEIAERLHGFSNETHYVITKAAKSEDGSWYLTVKCIKDVDKRADAYIAEKHLQEDEHECDK